MGNSASEPEALEADKQRLLEKFAEEEAALADPQAAQQTLERCEAILENSRTLYERLMSTSQRSSTNGAATSSAFGSNTAEILKNGRLWRARQQFQKARFNFGWALVQQPLRSDREQIREGIHLLQSLAEELEADLVSEAGDEGLLYECHFFAAYGLYRLGDWSGARQQLRIPYHRPLGTNMQRRQTRAFLAILDDKIRRDGWIGLGVATALFGVAGAAVVAGSMLAAQRISRRDPHSPEDMESRSRAIPKPKDR
jgi:hypothetical protein